MSFCEISPCTFCDHDSVSLIFDASDVFSFSPGVWKFNNSLLLDQLFCDSSQAVIDQHLRFESLFSSVKDFWEDLKVSIKNRLIDFSKSKRTELSCERVAITNCLIVLKNKLLNGDLSVKGEITELESLSSAIYAKELDGVKIQSRAKWLEEGEKPSSYFFKLEREKFAKNYVDAIYDSEGTEVSSLLDIMSAQEEFYGNLFSREATDLDIQNELLSNVVIWLSESERDSCEGELTLLEISNALGQMCKNKSPGPDGLSAECYSKFWDLLGPLLVEEFNLCYADSNLCESMKSRVTNLSTL